MSAVSKALAVSQAALAGLALGDLQAVEWSDYNFDGPGHTTFGRYRERTGTPIDIPIQQWLTEILLPYRCDSGLICPHLPQSESSLNKGLKTILRRAGVEPGGFHRLRHSFATMVRGTSARAGHVEGDYAAYGRLMGHTHGSPSSLPPERKRDSDLVIGLRYDHADFERCLNLLKRVEADVSGARAPVVPSPRGLG